MRWRPLMANIASVDSARTSRTSSSSSSVAWTVIPASRASRIGAIAPGELVRSPHRAPRVGDRICRTSHIPVRRRHNVSEHRYIRVVWGLAALLVASAAFGQAVIKVNDNVNLKFGVLLQTQGDATQDMISQSYAQNVFIRRARILLGGQIAPNLTFFAETDSPNLFKSTAAGTKNNASQIILQDAYVNYKFKDEFSLDAGLLLVSPSRNGLQSAASLLPVDYGTYTFANSTALQNSAGRDTGIQARGYLAGKKLEYRAGVFQGMRDQLNRELRSTVRLQYNVFDPETTFFYTGSYLGKKKLLSLGAGYDHQHKYDGVAADIRSEEHT